MKRLLSALILSLLSPLTLPAKSGASDPPPTFRIISAAGSYQGLFYVTGAASSKTAIPINLNQSLTAPLERPPGSTLEIYRLVPPPPGSPPETPHTRQIVIKTDLPSRESGYILVTFPTSDKSNTPLLTKVVPPPTAADRAGTLRVINFSTQTVGIGIDQQQDTMLPDTIKTINSGVGRVLLQVAVNRQGNWLAAFRGERRIAPQLRGNIFVFDYMVDPDYGPADIPPPAVVKTMFEVSPETMEPSK